MSEGPSGARPGRWGRRALIFLLGAAIWTLVSCYPNPYVLVRNLARYRHLPIDPRIEERMGWQLLPEPGQIELFVDSMLVPTPDWQVHRVPWYVPTAGETAQSSHGDCEAKAILLASLLAGKDLPFEIRASLTHIWVDYPGRRARSGENRDLAYLEGEGGRLRLQWPGRVPWGRVLAAQREQLWDAMPLARKTLWLIGIVWVGLAVALSGGSTPAGEIASRWRPRATDYLWRTCWLAALIFLATLAAANAWPEWGRSRWRVVDLWEVLAASAAAGGLAAWLSAVPRRRSVTVEDDGDRLVASSTLGPWQRSRGVYTEDVARVELRASAGGLQPWTVSAMLRTGERVPLLDYREEVTARGALRRLGLALRRRLVVRADRFETWTAADEISHSLRQRATGQPPPPLTDPPRGCVLSVADSEGSWAVRLPPPGRRAGLELVVFAAAPVLLATLTTIGVLRCPGGFLLWVGWVVSASLLGLMTYLAIVLRGEIVGYLAETRLEMEDGTLRYYTPEGKTESIRLDDIETVEMGRRGQTLTVAIVTPEQVLHIRGLGQADHQEWLRNAIEAAAIGAPRPERHDEAEDPSA